MAQEVRKPKIGDVVRAIGHSDAFLVIKVDDRAHTADIKLVCTGDVLTHAPWMALSYATLAQTPVDSGNPNN